MDKPFEGVLGNNCELRIIEFLLPLKDIEFNISELADEVGISRPTATRVIKKFVDHGIMKVSQERSGIKYYDINYESPYVRIFENLNNVIIEEMLGEETLYEIHDHFETQFSHRKLFEKEKLEPASDISQYLEDNEPSWLELEREKSRETLTPQLDQDSLYYGGEQDVAG